jgi:hypothetical protein
VNGARAGKVSGNGDGPESGLGTAAAIPGSSQKKGQTISGRELGTASWEGAVFSNP